MTRKLDLTGSQFNCPVKLMGAEIAGQFNCSGAVLKGRDNEGRAFAAANIKVDGDVILKGLQAERGAVQLLAGNIAKTLDCEDAKLRGWDRDDRALAAANIKVGGDVILKGLSTKKGTPDPPRQGAPDLLAADVGQSLNCKGAKFEGTDEKGYALDADRMTIGGDVYLDDNLTLTVSSHFPGLIRTGHSI